VEFVNLASRRLNLRLPNTLVFDFPTSSAIISHLSGLLTPAVASDSHPTGRVAPAASLVRGAAAPCAAATEGPHRRAVSVMATLLRPLEGVDGSAAASGSTAAGLLPMADAIITIPYQRWDVDGAAAAAGAAAGAAPVRFGAFMRSIDAFDAAAFGLSAGEAVAMDPQHRLLLEAAVKLRASRPKAPSQNPDATGVFIGISWTEYAQLAVAHGQVVGTYSAQGAVLSVACGRISYHLGLQGPSMSVDTACSSSLVASHLGCQALLGGTASNALAGGINMMLLPSTTAMFAKAGMLAADGRCKTIDAAADGYVRAEACAMTLLAPGIQADAVALLVGTAVNQDGRASSLTAPSGPAQQSAMQAALAEAGMAGGGVGGLVMHGTGECSCPLDTIVVLGACAYCCRAKVCACDV
jgi:3-oxoacyl-(acyl-carrier-protein) synthase